MIMEFIYNSFIKAYYSFISFIISNFMKFKDVTFSFYFTNEKLYILQFQYFILHKLFLIKQWTFYSLLNLIKPMQKTLYLKNHCEAMIIALGNKTMTINLSLRYSTRLFESKGFIPLLNSVSSDILEMSRRIPIRNLMRWKALNFYKLKKSQKVLINFKFKYNMLWNDIWIKFCEKWI